MDALLFAVLTSTLAAQTPDSSTLPPSPDPDRIVIDAAAIVRDGGVQSLADLLNGRVPGLLVVSGSALNGGGSRIHFAGPRRLLGDGSPLFLVDGIRVDATADASQFELGGPGPLRLEDFNVEDIASIEVIRSPADAMLYGPGAADGVILITTKRGRSGRLQVDGYAKGVLHVVSARWPANYGGVDLDNPNPALRTGGCSLTQEAAGACVQDFVQSFNPLVQRSPFTNAIRRHAGFNATGGPRWGAFRLAGGVEGDGGIYDVPAVGNPDAYDGWNVIASGTIRPERHLDIAFTLDRIFRHVDLPNYSPIPSALLGPSDSSGFEWAPMFPRSPQQRVGRVTGVIEANAHLLPWLTARGMVGVDRLNQGDTAINPGVGRLYGLRQGKQNTVAVTISANNAVGALRFRTALGLERADGYRRDDLRSGPDTDPFCAGLCASRTTILRHHTVGYDLSEQVAIRDRLTVSAAVREDHFREYRQHQTNPRLAVAWLARRHRTGLLNALRLRAAYGSASETGSTDGFALVFVPIGTTLPVVRPDRVTSLETGADAQLFGGRWNAQVAVYDLRSDTKEAVLVANPSGCCQSTYASGAKISNRGIVATLSGSLLDRQGLGWSVQLSVWGNRNRLRRLPGPERIFNGYQGLLRNYPAAGYWGERVTGYGDANGDGIIDVAEVSIDRQPTWAGTPYPTQGAALQSSLRIGHHVHVSTMLDYRAGNVLLNQIALYRCQYAVCRDRIDPQTPLQRQAVAVAPFYAVPLQYFEDADYLKLRELQLSFDVPPGAVGILGARAATVSLAGRNLFTWTRYSGADPETGSYGTLAPGELPAIADFGTVPLPRSWALQVRVSY